jgi:hypothetical protein
MRKNGLDGRAISGALGPISGPTWVPSDEYVSAQTNRLAAPNKPKPRDKQRIRADRKTRGVIWSGGASRRTAVEARGAQRWAPFSYPLTGSTSQQYSIQSTHGVRQFNHGSDNN